MKLDHISNLPVLEANRFILRPMRKSDSGLLSIHLGDKRVAHATRSVPHPLPPGVVDGYIANAMADKREDDVWLMDGSANGHAEVIGQIWLTRMDRDQSEVTFWVAPQFWNTGLASEALNTLIAANPHRSKTMFAEVFQDNPASARVVTNAGFDYLGDAEAFVVSRNGAVPTWTYVKRFSDQ